MYIEDYKSRLRQLAIDYEKAKQNLAREYALANNPYKVGDIFTDHIGSIAIERIGVYLSSDAPHCVYNGLELKKDGTSTKRGNKRDAHQSNDIKNR